MKNKIILFVVFFLLFIPVVSAQSWNDVETWYYEFQSKSWNNVETWDYEMGTKIPVDITYVSPADGSSFTIYDFPIEFTVNLDNITLHNRCVYRGQQVDDKYCNDLADWNRPFYAFWEQPTCNVKRSFNNNTIGDEVDPIYCDGSYELVPSNELIFWLSRPDWNSTYHPDIEDVDADYIDTNSDVWIGYKFEDVGEGDHVVGFEAKDFKRYYDFQKKYPFGSWDTMFSYYDEELNATVLSLEKTITIEEPDVPIDIQSSLTNFDRNVTSRYGVLDNSLNEGGKMIVAFIVMIVFGSIVGYYGKWNSAVIVTLVFISFFLYINWLPQIFVIFLLVGAGFFVVRVFMYVFGE